MYRWLCCVFSPFFFYAWSPAPCLVNKLLCSKFSCLAPSLPSLALHLNLHSFVSFACFFFFLLSFFFLSSFFFVSRTAERTPPVRTHARPHARGRATSICFSPPGIAQSYRKFSVGAGALDRDLLHQMSVSVIPEYDFVPMIDTQVWTRTGVKSRGLVERVFSSRMSLLLGAFCWLDYFRSILI